MTKSLNIPRLYHSKTSVCSQKVRLVLAELDLAWESTTLDLKNGDQFENDYLKLNPNASVPTFIDGKITLTESSDIMLYLVQDKVEQSHLNITPHIYDDVDYWLTGSLRFHKAVHVLTTLAINHSKLLSLPLEQLNAKLDKIPDMARRQRIYDIVENGISSRAVADALSDIKDLYQSLDASLEDHEYLVGDKLTLADLAILPFVIRLSFLQLTPDWYGLKFPALENWIDRLKARPSFENAIMKFHSQAVIDKYQIEGRKVRNKLVEGN